MAEVVGAELQLEPVGGGLPLGRGHHAGVVDQQVDRPALGPQRRRRARRRSRGRRGRGRAGSGRRPGARCRIRATAASPLARLRTGRRTSAPAAARRAAMPRPMPSLAPVTTARRPVRSGMVRSVRVRGMGLLLVVGGRCHHRRPRGPLWAGPPEPRIGGTRLSGGAAGQRGIDRSWRRPGPVDRTGTHRQQEETAW